MPAIQPSLFRSIVALNAKPELKQVDPSGGRPAARTSLLNGVAALLEAGESNAGSLLAALPGMIAAAMEAHGWLWNGFYVLASDDKLHVAQSHGPPVCATLESSGGPLSSGMCFDGIALNQTLAAYAAKDWPGYVSCDASSGLSTVAGIVCPLRDPRGKPIAVWDMDSTQSIEAGDVRFMDIFFGTLARCMDIESTSFETADTRRP